MSFNKCARWPGMILSENQVGGPGFYSLFLQALFFDIDRQGFVGAFHLLH